ncbi:hypothetical protein [Terrarubrum flagellatum]|uniref:hypothetical protein n=1 Tax=Terrirubrum flagellatum TaxID=2895980 RepID=UPI00314559ED
MSAADWVENHLSAGKAERFVLTEFQRKAVEVLTTGLGAPWNVSLNWTRVDWWYGRGVAFVVSYRTLATYDNDSLTRLVIAAHDRLVRVEISAVAPSRLRVAMWPRTGREGLLHERHPTMEQAIESLRGVNRRVAA